MADKREVIFEFTRIGGMVKVTAVDVASGIEASIVSPATHDEAALRGLALRKLDYVLARKLHR